MEPTLTKIIEEMQQRAKTCETVALDKTQEALTGASSEKDQNTQDAKDWMIRSKVWLEAEGVVRECSSSRANRMMASPAGMMRSEEGESEL